MGGATLLLLLGGGSGPAPVAKFRDRDVYETMKAILVATGEFAADAVHLGKGVANARLSPDDSPWVVIQPLTDRTMPDGSPTREFHQCTYDLTFGVRDSQEPEDTWQTELDRLYAVIRNTLMLKANRTFGGRCLSDHTKLTDGSIMTTDWPGMARSLRGEFAYSVSLSASAYSVVA